MHGIQQVGLAGAIGPGETIHLLSQLQLGLAVIAELKDGKATKQHVHVEEDKDTAAVLATLEREDRPAGSENRPLKKRFDACSLRTPTIALYRQRRRHPVDEIKRR